MAAMYEVHFEEARQVIREGNTRILKKYLDSGLDANSVDSYGITLLCEAAAYGNSESIAELLNSGAEIDACNGCTALSAAVKVGNLDNAVFLVINHADVNKRNCDGTDPLCEALQGEYFEIADWLMKNGAKYRIGEIGIKLLLDLDDIPLDTMELLVHAGLDVNYQEPKSKYVTLLNWAVVKNNVKLVTKLLLLGADPNAIDFDGMTSLHYAILYGSNDKVVQRLILGKAKVNVIDEVGNTPLHYIVMKNCGNKEIRVINVLLQNGANLRRQNNRGETPYQIASRNFANNTGGRVMWTIRTYD